MYANSSSTPVLLFVTALALMGCSDVKEGLRSADQSLQSAFGTGDGAEIAQAQDGASGSTPTPPDAPDPGRAEAMYQQGLAARQGGDETGAANAFAAAAAQDHPAAAYEIGLAYSQGLGVPRDLDAAARWLNRATDLKEPRALYLAGLNHQSGLDVETDPAAAAAFFGEAAVRGHAKAQVKLADAFAIGAGVPKDLAWAQRWYGKAAWQGDPEAQFAYGVLLSAGKGFARDPTAARGWLLLAAQSGHTQAATAERAIAGRLGARQRQRSEAWARDFRPSPGGITGDRPTLRYVQQRLMELGYEPGPVDGLMGPRTRTAVASYRRDQGLPDASEIDDTLVVRLFETARNQS